MLKPWRILLLTGIFLILNVLPNYASKLILYTDNDSYGKSQQEKIWYLALGEPGFANFWDLRVPSQYFMVDSKGQREKLTLLRKELFDPWFNQRKIAFDFKVLVKEPGDYLLCFEGEDLLLGKGRLVRPFAKTIFHVEREGGWERSCGFDLEIRPFTRPYGLKAGALFWGQVLYQGEPLTEGKVEIERLRKQLNPRALPKDSTGEVNLPILIRTTRIDERGYFFVNFEEEGWWVITTKLPRGTKIFGNQNYPFELQSHLWVYVYPSEESRKTKGRSKSPKSR